MKKCLPALAAATLLAVAAAAPAFAAAPWGAIATETGTDNAVGHATGYATKNAAIAAAVAECNKYTSGKDDCKARVWFHKNRCAVYVANDKEFDYYFGDSKAEVVRKAHENFPDGQIVDTACN